MDHTPTPNEGDQSSVNGRAKAQEYKNTGNDKFNKNNYKGAVADYLKGLLHEPNNPDLHTNVSAAYLHLEKYIEAEEHAIYSISLRPSFYKGYMRAAKAAHGKGMTRLALKRLSAGLSLVTDEVGIKELNRLKKQYTAFLSLQSNGEREMEFDSDTYQSEEDDGNDTFTSGDDDSDDDSPPSPPPQLPLIRNRPIIELDDIVEPIDNVVSEHEEPEDPAVVVKSERPESDKERPEPVTSENPQPDMSEHPELDTSEYPQPDMLEIPQPDMSEHPEPETSENPQPDMLEHPQPDNTSTRHPEPDTSDNLQPDKLEHPEPDTSENLHPDKSDHPEPDTSENPQPDKSEHIELNKLQNPEPDKLKYHKREKSEDPEPHMFDLPEPMKSEAPELKTEPSKLVLIELKEPTNPIVPVEEKTNNNTEAVIISEGLKGPADDLESQKEVTPYDSFQENKIEKPIDRIRELVRNNEMKSQIESFKDNLKAGGEAFLSRNYRKAAENYKSALERVGKRYLDFETDERQCNVIRYASSAALINLSTYDDIVKGIQGLTEMSLFGFDIPAIFIQIAQGYYKLNRFKVALEPLEKLQEILENFPIFPTYTWPGTNEIMEETTPNGLKNSIKELNQLCRMSHKPTAVCRFDNCVKNSSHISPSELIYMSDPDFIGFVRMICEEKCHIEFHISCWKLYKESICGIGKINDKDFVGRRCLTMDCVNSDAEPSVITVIEIIDADGQVKSSNRLFPKGSSDHKSASDKKSKKKKSKQDDKESKDKVTKPKNTKEKKYKKPVIFTESIQHEVALEEEDDLEIEEEKPYVDPAKSFQMTKEALVNLRKINFGLNEKTYLNPTLPFYGRPEEVEKASKNQFLDQTNNVSKDVKDAKDFLFSYFLSILKSQGPTKMSDIEDHWGEAANEYCDMTVVLPNLKSMCDLLIESKRFCQLDDRLCLADHLDEAFPLVSGIVSDTVAYLLTTWNYFEAAEDDTEQTDSIKDEEDTYLSNDEEKSDDDSGSDSDESQDENSDDEDKDEEDNNFDEDKCDGEGYHIATSVMDILPPRIEPLKPLDDGTCSFQEMMNRMMKMKAMLERGAEGETSHAAFENDTSGENEESNSNDNFETAQESSADTTPEYIKHISSEDKQLSDNANDKPEENNATNDSIKTSLDADQTDPAEDTTHVDASLSQNVDNFFEIEHKKPNEEPSTAAKPPYVEEGFDSSECDKGSQSGVTTKEREIQTAALETKDRLSQTKESDLYKDLTKKVQDLSSQVATINKENIKLTKDLNSEKLTVKTLKDTIARLQEENRKSLELQKSLQEQTKAELSRKDKEHKKKEDELMKMMNNTKEMYTSLLADNSHLKKEMNAMVKDTSKLKESLSGALSNIKEFESSYNLLDTKLRSRIQKALQGQLNIIKVFLETQINQYKKRCVEKISETQSWFSISPGEVEDLPTYPLIQQNILQWVEIGKQIQQIESDFQVKYNTLESKISLGDDVEDLTPMLLPQMPKEPPPVPLDKMHRELSEKQVKQISELSKLVASQQLQIQKSKEQNEQLTQVLVNSYSGNQITPPRMPSPMTTAFGGLALQYPYPMTTQFPATSMAPVLPLSQDPAKIGNTTKLSEVQTLLAESSKILSTPDSTPLVSPGKLNLEGAAEKRQTPPLSTTYPFTSLSMPPPPLPMMTTNPLPIPGPGLSTPPPPIGVAQNLLKASSALIEKKKDTKPQEQRARTPKPETKYGSSRESTPGPQAVSVAPTPEKTKKKKKSKSVEAAAVEARLSAAINIDTPTVVDEAARDDNSGWNVVLGKSGLPKHPAQPSAPLTESKLKNKKRLLEKLQVRFPTTPVKDLDEYVKQVREQNNGSLSGLPFDEIEARVERIVTRKYLQKNSTMGLVKFSEAAWGTVKPQEIKSWSNLHHEECTICLEPMGTERTKVDCNHEFHTKCLRKWLKEKSVCPLCNKFTTMPDEFPAL